MSDRVLPISVKKKEAVFPAASFVPSSVIEIGAPSFWQRNYRGKGIKIAIIDSGIANVPSLQNAVVQRRTWLPVDQICNSHGTSIASIIAGRSINNDVCLEGIAPAADLYDYQIIGCKGGSVEAFVEALNIAIDDNVDIINMSIGIATPSNAIVNTVRRALDAGIILVAAAGNSGSNTLSYPGCLDGVISVGNYDLKRRRYHPSSSSSHTVSLTAPGTRVVAATFNGDFSLCTGTSIAAAHVSGLAALLIERYRRHHPFRSKERRARSVRKKLIDSTCTLVSSSEHNDHGKGTLCYSNYCLKNWSKKNSTYLLLSEI